MEILSQFTKPFVIVVMLLNLLRTTFSTAQIPSMKGSPSCKILKLLTPVSYLWTLLSYSLISLFSLILLSYQRVKFMAYTCGWGSLQVRFKINLLEPCWMSVPPQNVMPSILLVFVKRQFLLIVYKFVLRRVVFNCV